MTDDLKNFNLKNWREHFWSVSLTKVFSRREVYRIAFKLGGNLELQELGCNVLDTSYIVSVYGVTFTFGFSCKLQDDLNLVREIRDQFRVACVTQLWCKSTWICPILLLVLASLPGNLDLRWSALSLLKNGRVFWSLFKSSLVWCLPKRAKVI